MSGSEDDSARVFDPTPQKLLEARKKGDVPKSVDLMTAAGYAGLFSALIFSGPTGIRDAATALMVLLDYSTTFDTVFLEGSGQKSFGELLKPLLIGLLPIFFLPAIFVVLSIFVQKAWVFSISKVQPKLSRISVISNAKNKFGKSGIFEWAKSFAKLTMYSAVLGIFIWMKLPEILSTVQTSPYATLLLLSELSIIFLFVVIIISFTIGIIDAVWQHADHIRKNRMSHKEISDEAKNSEGDPHLKQERRQRAISISQNQMLADVPTSDVIIVNPTHYAVALKWSRLPGEAPVCVAKGVDEIAMNIREKAQLAGVPIYHDPPTARSIFATTEVGFQISPDFYGAVAASIQFSESMRKRMRVAIC